MAVGESAGQPPVIHEVQFVGDDRRDFPENDILRTLVLQRVHLFAYAKQVMRPGIEIGVEAVDGITRQVVDAGIEYVFINLRPARPHDSPEFRQMIISLMELLIYAFPLEGLLEVSLSASQYGPAPPERREVFSTFMD